MIQATKMKLQEARFFFGHLERESGPLHSSGHFDYFLSAFLSAGRSVTFALQSEDKQSYDHWFPGWKRNDITADDRELLTFMNDQRVESVHGTGAEVEISNVVVPMQQFMQEVTHRGWQIYMHSGVPGTPRPDIIGQTRKFPALKDEDVVAVCRKYLDLLSRLVSDFESSTSERNDIV